LNRSCVGLVLALRLESVQMVTSAPLNQLDVTPLASRHAVVVIASDLDPSRPRGRNPTRHRDVRSVGRRRRRAPRVALPRARAFVAVVEGVDALFLVDFPEAFARTSTRAPVGRSVVPRARVLALFIRPPRRPRPRPRASPSVSTKGARGRCGGDDDERRTGWCVYGQTVMM
jgi:hypothetical protein